MVKEIEDEIKKYLNFIRSIGIKAWIPGSSENYPEMSVADQCQSGVLCLSYKGSNIYIQGNNFCAKNNKKSTEFVKNLDRGNSEKYKLLDRFYGYFGNTAVNDNLSVNIILPSAVVKPKRDVGIQWNNNDIIDDSLEILENLKNHSRFKKSVKTGIDSIQNKILVPEVTGMQFKRIVEEKLTREVRVAKCYVSSLPNCEPNYGIAKNSNCHLDKKTLRLDYTGKLWNSFDCKHSPEIKKSGLSPGFVRQLIKKFDVCDNVEQQCPKR